MSDTLFRIECPWPDDRDHQGECFVPVETEREWRCAVATAAKDLGLDAGDCGDWPESREEEAHAACGWRTYVKEEET